MKKWLAILLAALMMFAICAGCNNDETNPPDDDKQNSSDDNNKDPDDTQDPTPGNDPANLDADRDEVTIVLTGAASQVSPNYRLWNAERINAWNCYETLLVYHGSEPVPYLAESWEYNEDGTELTFHLRENVTFSDGTPFVSEDVKASIENNRGSAYQSTYSDGIIDVKCPDEHTVVIVTGDENGPAPNALVLYNLTWIYILPHEKLETETNEWFKENLCGTGPYEITDWDKTTGATIWEYRDDYWGEEYWGHSAYIKKVTGYVYEDEYSRSLAAESGEVEFCRLYGESTYDTLVGVEGLTIEKCPTYQVYFLVFNNEREPWNNKLVRQAASYALNRQMILETTNKATGVPATSLCNTEMVGYSEDVQQFSYDVEKAKELLAQAGITTPYDVTDGSFIYDDGELHAQVIAQNLADVGINVTLEKRDSSTLGNARFNGDFSLVFQGPGSWGNDLGHLSEIFLSSKIGSGMNWSRYSNPEVDKMFSDLIHNVNADERTQIAHDLLSTLQDEAPQTSIFAQGEIFVYETGLHCPMYTDGIYYFMNWYWTK